MLQDKARLQQEEFPSDWHMYEYTQYSRTTTGLTPCLSGALTYLFGFITGILFLLVERENKFIRFHAWQSIYVSVVLIGLHLLVDQMPVIGWHLGVIVMPATIVLWIILMLSASSGKWPKTYVFGRLAEKQSRIASAIQR